MYPDHWTRTYVSLCLIFIIITIFMLIRRFKPSLLRPYAVEEIFEKLDEEENISTAKKRRKFVT